LLKQGKDAIERYNQLLSAREKLRAAIQAEQNILKVWEMQKELAVLNDEIYALKGALMGGRPLPPPQ
jgi:hypothetical protein